MRHVLFDLALLVAALAVATVRPLGAQAGPRETGLTVHPKHKRRFMRDRLYVEDLRI